MQIRERQKKNKHNALNFLPINQNINTPKARFCNEHINNLFLNLQTKPLTRKDKLSNFLLTFFVREAVSPMLIFERNCFT